MNGIRRTLGIMLVGAMTLSSTATGQDTRRSVSGTVALELNGSQVGFLRGADGGNIKAEVVSVASGSFAKKHISSSTIEDLALEMGSDMNKAVYDWITASWDGKQTLANGAVLASSYDYKVLARREFSQAAMVETRIPSLEASSKEPASLAVVLRPEGVRMVKGAGSVQPTMGGASKGWITGNFRLDIPGLDCTRVRKIDGFAIKMSPGKIEFPNLKVSLTENTSETWAAWFKSMVVDGNSGESAEKTGSIVFLAGDMSTELGRINLFNVGISSLQYEGLGSANAIRTVTAELYCERMAFAWTGGPGGNVLQTRTLLR